MAQWLGTSATLAEELGLFSSQTYIAAHNHLLLQFQGSDALSELRHQACIWYSYMHTGKTLKRVKLNIQNMVFLFEKGSLH